MKRNDQMNERKFKVGDVVSLKSGGPWMTVTRIWMDEAHNPNVDTAWFTSGGKESKGSFLEDWLELDELRLRRF
jgi:uncharacterized protein YodC (DUF2158 family)